MHGDSMHIFINMEAEQFTHIAQKKEIVSNTYLAVD